MKTVLYLVAALLFTLWGRAAVIPRAVPVEDVPPPQAISRIDELVFGKLERLGIHPTNVCSDAVFLRRVYLDVIGTLPTAKEAADFLQESSPGKRGALIEELLQRDEFAGYWAMKWSELLRVKAEFPINLWPNAAQAYHRWIYSSLRENKPYDRFVREMLTSSGSNFRVGQVNFYRAMQDRTPRGIAQTVALTTMGVRAEKWPQATLDGMSAIFSQVGYKATGEWKEEIVFFNPESTNAQPVSAMRFPDGTTVALQAEQDPREAFADWLLEPANPWFRRNIANRVWSWFLGRGIIHEPDDIRPDNAASNPELLNLLETELLSSGYDLKHLYRLILNSKTYQLPSVPCAATAEAQANFAAYPLRRIEAEVLIDALNSITGSTEKYSSAIPEPFTFVPEDKRSILLPDGSISSAFLELFGRPSRDTGLESERNSRPSPDQQLHLLNSSHIQNKLEQSKRLRALIQSSPGIKSTVTELYLSILSRDPTQGELDTAIAYSKTEGLKAREAMLDIAWALLNSAEFLYRH
jgi:hypothetical protein